MIAASKNPTAKGKTGCNFSSIYNTWMQRDVLPQGRTNRHAQLRPTHLPGHSTLFY